MIVVALILLLTACSQKTSPKKNDNETTQKEVTPEKEGNEKSPKEDNNVVTKDNAVVFKLINSSKASKEELNKFKERVLGAYAIVKDSIETDYTPAKNIRILLQEGTGTSTGYRHNIKLYAKDMDDYPLVHEMTHTILGYGKNFDSTRGFFTQEGFGVYMEEKYGNLTTVNFGFTNHKIMKYFITMDKTIPVSSLMDADNGGTYFRPVINDQKDAMLRWISYIHAGSFIGFLIESYGLEKFEKVYNKAGLAVKFENVYGKPIKELEKGWLTYIKNTVKITTEDKEKVNNLDQLNAILETMDAELFKR